MWSNYDNLCPECWINYLDDENDEVCRSCTKKLKNEQIKNIEIQNKKRKK